VPKKHDLPSGWSLGLQASGRAGVRSGEPPKSVHIGQVGEHTVESRAVCRRASRRQSRRAARSGSERATVAADIGKAQREGGEAVCAMLT